MLKACVIVATLSVSLPAHAFLDSIVDGVKDVAEAAAVSAAVTDMVGELDPASAPDEANKDVQKRNEDLQHNVNDAKYISNETKKIMNGPDTTSKRLSQNIRFTTSFIKRTKALLTKIGILSPAVQTAVNTAQQTTQMNESLQNQQTMMQLQQEQFTYQKSRDAREEEEWNRFAAEQRAIRNGNGGK